MYRSKEYIHVSRVFSNNMSKKNLVSPRFGSWVINQKTRRRKRVGGGRLSGITHEKGKIHRYTRVINRG